MITYSNWTPLSPITITNHRSSLDMAAAGIRHHNARYDFIWYKPPCLYLCELSNFRFLLFLFTIDITCSRVFHSLNSPFFPPQIGAEPGRAKRESRITCMPMLRTNQWKIARPLSIRVHTKLLASMCHAMLFFSSRSDFFDVYIVVKNKLKCGLL